MVKVVELDGEDLKRILDKLPEELGELFAMFLKKSVESDAIDCLKKFTAQYEDDCQIDVMAAQAGWDVIRSVIKAVSNRIAKSKKDGEKGLCGLEAGRLTAAAIRSVADKVEKAVDEVVKDGDHTCSTHH